MQHIIGSSFFVDTVTTATEASSSTAEGTGLSGGVAGEPLSFVVQANDERQREVQALVGWAEVKTVASSCRSLEAQCYWGDVFCRQHVAFADGIVTLRLSPRRATSTAVLRKS